MIAAVVVVEVVEGIKLLTEEPENYKIRKEEYVFSNFDINNFPISFSDLTFWEDSNVWIMRFAEGKFSICDSLE